MIYPAYGTIHQSNNQNVVTYDVGENVIHNLHNSSHPTQLHLIILLIIWLLFCFQVRKYVQGFIKPGLTMIEIW